MFKSVGDETSQKKEYNNFIINLKNVNNLVNQWNLKNITISDSEEQK